MTPRRDTRKLEPTALIHPRVRLAVEGHGDVGNAHLSGTPQPVCIEIGEDHARDRPELGCPDELTGRVCEQGTCTPREVFGEPYVQLVSVEGPVEQIPPELVELVRVDEQAEFSEDELPDYVRESLLSELYRRPEDWLWDPSLD